VSKHSEVSPLERINKYRELAEMALKLSAPARDHFPSIAAVPVSRTRIERLQLGFGVWAFYAIVLAVTLFLAGFSYCMYRTSTVTPLIDY
jgi:hypothetical protein